MNWVWENSQAAGNSRLVLLAIADRCHEDGSGAWPALETLQGKTLLSESTVRRCINDLVVIGELEIGRRKGRSNTYRIRYESRVSQPAIPARTVVAEEGCQIDTPSEKPPSAVKPRQFDRGAKSEQRGVSTPERGGVPAVTPDPSSTPKTSVHSDVPERRKADGQSIRGFLGWFCDAYRAALRAPYRVNAKRDVPQAKSLLTHFGDEELRAMAQAMLDEQHDTFIVKSDRGIGVLSTKSNWLASRRAALSQRTITASKSWSCPHVVECPNQGICDSRLTSPWKYKLREGVSA